MHSFKILAAALERIEGDHGSVWDRTRQKVSRNRPPRKPFKLKQLANGLNSSRWWPTSLFMIEENHDPCFRCFSGRGYDWGRNSDSWIQGLRNREMTMVSSTRDTTFSGIGS